MENKQEYAQLGSGTFAAARFIKEIGRGKEGARSLSVDDAQLLYAAMLEGRISDLEMGGILLAMRIKGESVEEITGFLVAAETAIIPLSLPMHTSYAPVVIPSYNGARKKANLTPLLALLLAREGVPVLLHGVAHDAGRVTSLEVFAALSLPQAHNGEEVRASCLNQLPAVMSIEDLSPAMNRILQMRKILGVRNSTHTLVKILQPFNVPALRLTSYTHPEYQIMLDRYFLNRAPHSAGASFLMRATEGETVASTGRAQQIDCYLKGQKEMLSSAQTQLIGEPENLPLAIDAITTAAWIKQVLAGQIPVPHNIARQVELCLRIARQLKAGE